MTCAGWILLILSWACIIALNVFCFAKVFGAKDDEPPAHSGDSSRS